MRVTFIALFALAALPASAQSVVETRTFQDEHFVATGNSYFFDLGLQSPTDLTHGTIVQVHSALQIEVDYEFRIRNQGQNTVTFSYMPETALTPLFGDCSPYQYINFFGGSSGPVAPGALGVIAGVDQVSGSFTRSMYEGYCGAPWPWTKLHIWHGVVSLPPDLTYGGGFSAWPWVESSTIDFQVNGTLTVEWTPTPVPVQSICPGSHSSRVNLLAGGPQENFWLMQNGAPDAYNLLLVSRDATSIVPASGLCVGGNGSPVLSLPGSLSHGGEPYRWAYPAALGGQTLFLQSYFRTPGGGAATGECVAVLLP